MAFLNKKGSDPFAEIEAEISRLIERKQILEGRLADARVDLTRVRDERRTALLDADLYDVDAVARHDQACCDTDDRVSGLEDAVLGLNGRLADAEQKVAAELDRQERATAARELTELTDLLQSTIDAYTTAGARLIEVLTPVVGRIPSPVAMHLRQLVALERNIGAALAQTLAAAQVHATRVVEGNAAIVCPAEPSAAPPPKPTEAMQEILLLAPSRWMTADGEVHTAGAHCRVAVPTRVADAALRHGHAFPAESEAAQRILMIQGPDYAYHRPEHCVDLAQPKADPISR